MHRDLDAVFCGIRLVMPIILAPWPGWGQPVTVSADGMPTGKGSVLSDRAPHEPDNGDDGGDHE